LQLAEVGGEHGQVISRKAAPRLLDVVHIPF